MTDVSLAGTLVVWLFLLNQQHLRQNVFIDKSNKTGVVVFTFNKFVYLFTLFSLSFDVPPT